MASLDQQQESRTAIFNAINRHLSCYGHKLAENHLISYPDDSLIWLELGEAASKLSRYTEAQSAFVRAFADADEELKIHILSAHAEMFRRQGKLKRAENLHREAIHISPNLPWHYVHAGILAFRQGNLKNSETTYRQGIVNWEKSTDTNEDTPDECYANLGSVLGVQERYEESIECFEKAIELDPDYKWAKFRLRDARKALKLNSSLRKDTNKSEKESRQALSDAVDSDYYLQAFQLAKFHLQKYPKDGIAWIEFARTLTQLSRYAEAEEAFNHAWIYAHEILREIIYTEKAKMYFRQGKLASAEKYYRKAIELHPEHADDYAMAGKMAFYRGNWNAAEETFRQGITRTGKNGNLSRIVMPIWGW